MAAVSLTAVSDVPPSRKRLSSTATAAVPTVWPIRSHRICSTSVAAAAPGASDGTADAATAIRARSSLPLGVSGSRDTGVTAAGSIVDVSTVAASARIWAASDRRDTSRPRTASGGTAAGGATPGRTAYR